VADDLGVTNAAASQMVDRLVQLGMLERSEDPEDRRARQLRLTDLGRALVERSVEVRRRWMEELILTLTPEQQTQITDALSILTKAAQQADL
jgi:DNA-binding MarR family transcriptional regulator